MSKELITTLRSIGGAFIFCGVLSATQPDAINTSLFLIIAGTATLILTLGE